MPKRIQRKRTKGWRMPKGAVNCSRPCDWSNPFRVGDMVHVRQGRHDDWILTGTLITPTLAVALFEALVLERGWEQQIRQELAGKDLVCWCKRGEPCHVDVLLRIANPPPTITIFGPLGPAKCRNCGEPQPAGL